MILASHDMGLASDFNDKACCRPREMRLTPAGFRIPFYAPNGTILSFEAMAVMRFLARAWFYFRLGYSVYLTFLIGAANTLTVLYYLLIRNVPELAFVFPKFWTFALVAIASGVPLAVLVGLFHMKRSPLYASELDISVEANPYYYRLPPGYWREVIVPSYLELLRHTRRLLEKHGALTAEDEARYRELEEKMETLIRGGAVR